jgi:squalene-hopene/tetraprenyl-beta-curcumene cyclase
VNYVYGTGAVLPALRALGEDMESAEVRIAVQWLREHQNGDGGWGESCVSYVDPEYKGRGPSTASQTAWALLALLAAGQLDDDATRAGVGYLLRTQLDDGAWDEPYFTGTGFPGYGVGQKTADDDPELYRSHEMPAGFMINYHMYRYCWPLMALGRYKRQLARELWPAARAPKGESFYAWAEPAKRPSNRLHRFLKIW